MRHHLPTRKGCFVSKCGKRIYARALCRNHYVYAMRNLPAKEIRKKFMAGKVTRQYLQQAEHSALGLCRVCTRDAMVVKYYQGNVMVKLKRNTFCLEHYLRVRKSCEFILKRRKREQKP